MAKEKKTPEQVENAAAEVLNPETPAPQKMKAVGPKATKTEKNIYYLLGREPNKDDKMAAQCATVYQHIANHCGQHGKCERKALIAGITPEELKTRQGVDRIVAYYIPALIKSGLISKEVEVTETPKPAVVETAAPKPLA